MLKCESRIYFNKEHSLIGFFYRFEERTTAGIGKSLKRAITSMHSGWSCNVRLKDKAWKNRTKVNKRSVY